MLDILFLLIRMLFVAALAILAPFIGGYLVGGWGVLIGLMFSFGIYINLMDAEAHYPQTSTCLKCGGSGRFTAADGRYVGFQCEKCKRFWKTKIRYY